MEIRRVQCKTALSRSGLPGLDWALNPYRGCGHACSYCYAQDVTRFEMARPWGDVVEVKVNIVSRLKDELRNGVRGVYGIGTVTDPYQPAERKFELTRRCLEVLRREGAKVSILTKSDLVLRDLDLLRGWEGAEVGVSIGCSDDRIAQVIEPGAPSPSTRFSALKSLSEAGIDIYLMAAPIVSPYCDSEQQLVELVTRATAARVRRLMWDKFNPKPCAGARLRRAIESSDLLRAHPPGTADWKAVKAVLKRECQAHGIELLDAF